MLTKDLTNILRVVSGGLEIPVLLILLVLIALSVILMGTLIAELFTERVRLTAKLPQLVAGIRNESIPLETTISGSGLLKRQKAVLHQLSTCKELTPAMREALARRLIFEEQSHYDKITKVSDVVARIGPMVGLMGTLIPLGPGLLSLGQGDIYSLSQSLLVAFDTTIAGLCTAALAFIISAVRKSWYENYMTMLEAVMECILDREGERDEKA